jgi:hypothetical protein
MTGHFFQSVSYERMLRLACTMEDEGEHAMNRHELSKNRMYNSREWHIGLRCDIHAEFCEVYLLPESSQKH